MRYQLIYLNLKVLLFNLYSSNLQCRCGSWWCITIVCLAITIFAFLARSCCILAHQSICYSICEPGILIRRLDAFVLILFVFICFQINPCTCIFTCSICTGRWLSWIRTFCPTVALSQGRLSWNSWRNYISFLLIICMILFSNPFLNWNHLLTCLCHKKNGNHTNIHLHIFLIFMIIVFVNFFVSWTVAKWYYIPSF